MLHAGPDIGGLRQGVFKNPAMGARSADKNDVGEVLARMIKQPPLTIDLDELQDVLTRAEKAKVPNHVLKSALHKYEYAERVQMQARVKKLISEFDELLKPDPLDVDTAKLIEAINFADGKPGIPDGLLEKAEEKLLIAEEEQEKRRQEIRAAAAAVIEKLLSPTPMFLDVEELTKAMAAGEEVSVDKDVLDRAHGKIRVAARRTAAASSLQYLATANPDEADVSALRAAMKEATDAGVQMEAVRDAQFVLRAAEKAQAPKNAAAALLKKLTSSAVIDIDLDAAGRAMVAAKTAGVDEDTIEEANGKITAAQKSQGARDGAAAAMVLAVVAPSFDVGAAKKAVAAAKEAGVSASLIESVEAKFDTSGVKSVSEVKQGAAVRARATAESTKEASAAAAKAHAAAKETVKKAKELAEVQLGLAQSVMLGAVEADHKLLADHQKEEAAPEASTKAAHPLSSLVKACSVTHVGPLAGADDEHNHDGRPVPLSEQHGEEVEPREQSPEEVDDDVEYLHSVRMSKAPGSTASLSEGSKSTRGGSMKGSAKPAEPTPSGAHKTVGDLWDACLAARKKYQKAEKDAGEAWVAFEVAVHEAEIAERLAAAAGISADWAHKEADAYATVAKIETEKAELEKAKMLAQLKPRPAPAEKATASSGKKKKGGGCCGGGKSADVIEIEVQERKSQMPEAPGENSTIQAKPPPPVSGEKIDGLDGLSWAPLQCGRAPNKLALLKGLALNGAYHNDIVCDAVATELAAVDPVSSAGLVQELAAALPRMKSSDAVELGRVADVWLSKILLDLISSTSAAISAGEMVSMVVESTSFTFKRTLRALLEAHYSYAYAEQQDDLSHVHREGSFIHLQAHPEEAEPDTATNHETVAELHVCIAHMLGATMHSHERFVEMLPVWTAVDKEGSVLADPPAALVATAHHFADALFIRESGYKSRRDGKKLTKVDEADERVVLAFVGLFVEQPDRLTGFQAFVPKVFDTYLQKGSGLREQLCSLLLKGSMDPGLVERVRTNDKLVAQEFFWSAPGMKLFGDDDALKDEAKLIELLEGALKQQPAIFLAWLQMITADGKPSPFYLKNAVVGLCSFVKAVGVVKHSSDPDPAINEAVGILLELASKRKDDCYDAVLDGCRSCEESSVLLEAFAASFFRPHIGIPAAHHRVSHVRMSHAHAAPRMSRVSQLRASMRPRSSTSDEGSPAPARPAMLKSSSSMVVAEKKAEEGRGELTTAHSNIKGLERLGSKGGGSMRSMPVNTPSKDRAARWGAPGLAHASTKGDIKDEKRDEYIIQTLANFFVAEPATLTAFSQLVPRVFETHLRLGTEQRARLNTLLMEKSFDENLEKLIADSDELVSAPFFWHASIIPLCTKERIGKSFPGINGSELQTDDGQKLKLYPRLLSLLLRLSSSAAGADDADEIARRTVEVLDQFERNPEQQTFILTIFNKLDERTRGTPEDFSELKLTTLSEVAANGVQTVTSVQGEGMELCEKAMTTLLQGYIANEHPSKWKGLFKDATNIAFMVKYMFREQLSIAKEKFNDFVNEKSNFKKMPNAGDVQSLLKRLVQSTLMSYGEVGIFDPEKLAEIDFLNQPELLVDLVSQSKSRASRVDKDDMQLITEVTTNWMKFMIEKQFPPLTPHHTQAFIVMMMARFFKENLSSEALASKGKKDKLKLKAFVAQMSTGEGKSIVIAMTAIFMVKLFGLKVHVLENNAGLLDRDYATNEPFYAKFGIKSGKDLSDPDVQICYCLKAAINKHFLRGMVAGSLELARTVLIVDEVDDLIVNERPNAHYVKLDVQKTPDLISCLAALKLGQDKPEGVADDIWARAHRDMQIANSRVEGKHYRVIQDDDGNDKVIMLDSDGRVPKVPLTAPWLKALAYKLCGTEPSADSHFACVCTPYVFNKYAGIFGLTGSVGGKAELDYLTKTYHAVKFDVPRFLDTCIGNARKVVLNHGVELHDGPEAQHKRVLELCHQYYRKVPVLVIAATTEELVSLHKQISEAGVCPADEVQRFSEFDSNGASLKAEWQTIIDDATKRIGGAEDNRCRVTVTDRFGGRGHDFQVVDKEANANGGMLVIATSIPDEREWIQWKGRTARQDRPGQFYVILDQKAKPFIEKKEMAGKIKKMTIASGEKKGQPDHDSRIEALLDCADDGIGDKLKAFGKEQTAGELLNEVAEKYFLEHPRDFDAPWPSEAESDKILREFMTTMIDATPEDIKKIAKERLGITVGA